eukprot:TRINITY_DN30752_c0_g1_i1.p1 TRINITY_DN30752_c0_g1~~TRINITY_DN30752_c0_g1_i1.p1  ORF type:complete len:103 (-),score=19.03 TRINITY_DN30752_c0_g1_i1:81-389(-)
MGDRLREIVGSWKHDGERNVRGNKEMVEETKCLLLKESLITCQIFNRALDAYATPPLSFLNTSGFSIACKRFHQAIVREDYIEAPSIPRMREGILLAICKLC